ncbi:MAG: hypothetical protein H6729_14645 [Deltaproteobacteria bacterium]|nr:hypothetical protein [Deltaproteobacteria bacterium]
MKPFYPLAILSLAACASSTHGKQTSDGYFDVEGRKIPIVRRRVEPPPVYSLTVVPSDPSSWKDLESEVAKIDGKDALTATVWTYGGDVEPEVAAKLDASLRKSGADALRALLRTALDQASILPDPPAPIATHKEGGKTYQLFVCEQPCFDVAAKGATSFAAALQKIREMKTHALERRAETTELKTLKRRFADLDPAHWTRGEPWWVGLSASVVPFVDGEKVLVGTAVASPTPGQDGSSSLRRTQASDRARAALAQALSLRVQKAPQGTISTSEIKLIGVTIEAIFERGADTYALALCDQECIQRTTASMNAVPTQALMGAFDASRIQ